MQTNIEQQANALIPINTNVGSYASRIVSAMILVAALAAFLYLIWGGVQWVSSGGSKDKIQEAKEKITQALIGLAVVAAGWAIYLLVDYFFGIGLTGGSSKGTPHSTPSSNTCSSSPPTAVVCYGQAFNTTVDDNWTGSCGFTKKPNTTYKLVCRRTTGNSCAAVCVPK